MFPDLSKLTDVLSKLDLDAIKEGASKHLPAVVDQFERLQENLEAVSEGIDALVEASQFQSFVSILPLYMDAERNYNAQGHAEAFAVLVEAFRKSGEIAEKEPKPDPIGLEVGNPQ